MFTILLVLAFAAGAVDAIGFFLLAHVLTSHATGNTAWLGTSVITGDWMVTFVRLTPIAALFAGAATGALLAELAARRGRRATLWRPLLVECGLLLLFIAGAWSATGGGRIQLEQSPVVAGLAFLLAFAMGLQNSGLTAAGEIVPTTYMTGNLIALARESVGYALDPFCGRPRRSFDAIAKPLGAWVAFLLGVIACGSLVLFTGAFAALVPCALAAVVAAADLRKPIGR